MRVDHHATGERELRLGFSFDRADLSLEYTLIGVVVRLAGCPTAGEPGSPALPRCVSRVALPPRSRLIGVQAEARETVRISDELLPIAPLQPSRPAIVDGGRGRAPAYRRPGEEQRGSARRPRDPRRDGEPFVEPFPEPRFVPADRDLYAEATARPAARLLHVDGERPTPVATIHLNPVRLTADGLLELSSRIDLILHYEPAEGEEYSAPAHVTSRAQAMRDIALTRLTVANPDLVLDYSDIYPIVHPGVEYLIITDNQRWNAQTMTPAGDAGGDLVASFERLAKWKRQRGLKARVVTISDIMADQHGKFRTGSRDLQEVIRKFLKMAQRDWGVAWVLLGGDTDIVPVRRAASGKQGYVGRKTIDPPPEDYSFWTGSHLRMHVVNPGTWWGAATTNLLVRPGTGMLIPFDADGTSNSTTRGWYFTTDESYSTRTAMPTPFVRVNGPAGEVDADLQFLYEWNTIPTDLYYSSLVGPRYDEPGKHDWDLVDNGVYGQHNSAGELDGVHYTPTVSLGRAPVGTAAQADAFVDKVIAYEKYKRPNGTSLDNDWVQQVVLVSDNWDWNWRGRIGIAATDSHPPEDDRYRHAAGDSHTLIKLKDLPNWNWSLLAEIGEGDVRLMPYRTDAATAGRGWYFATGADDLTPSALLVPLPSGVLIPQPLPSQWIAVFGPADELAPQRYIFNSTQLDTSLSDQEKLRLQIRSEMPGFTSIKRLYEDIEDMTPEQVAADPLALISTSGLRDALDAGVHIVSLSGHGNSDGCCKLSRNLADSLTNGYHTFIAYADSCLTNQFDGDALSEHLLGNPHGGAVAYVGNTRFSWIGVGDDFQRRFFKEWATLGGDAHLGLLFDTRAGLLDQFWWDDSRWSILALNLMGDPEMPLWWHAPLKIPSLEIDLIDKLKLLIDPDPPDPPFRIDLPYRRNWGLTYAHLRQGEREQLLLAGSAGRVELPLTGFQPGAATLTVTRPGYQPVVQEIELGTAQEGRPGRNRPLLAVLLLLAGMLLFWLARGCFGG